MVAPNLGSKVRVDADGIGDDWLGRGEGGGVEYTSGLEMSKPHGARSQVAGVHGTEKASEVWGGFPEAGKPLGALGSHCNPGILGRWASWEVGSLGQPLPADEKELLAQVTFVKQLPLYRSLN